MNLAAPSRRGIMLKRTVLATAVAALALPTVNAAPFQPMDARGIAMGNTGVASAKRAHAPAYNPSMLAQEFGKDGFAILLPQVGIAVADEGEMIDIAQDISDEIIPNFERVTTKQNSFNTNNLETKVENLQAALEGLTSTTSTLTPEQRIQALKNSATELKESLIEVGSVTDELTSALNRPSGRPLSAQIGLGSTIAIPSKKIATAVSFGGSGNVSARMKFSDKDNALINSYVPAAAGFADKTIQLSDQLTTAEANSDAATAINSLTTDAQQLAVYDSEKVTGLDDKRIIEGGKFTQTAADPSFTSTVEVVAVTVMDVGVSFASEFEFAGHAVAIGVTPKIQKISTFHYGDEVDGFDDIETDDVKEYQKDYTDFNLDIGASYRFGANNNWMAGAVIKNILGGSYAYQDIDIKLKDSDGNIIPGATKHLHGGEVKLNPQVRGGIAYHSKWFNAAFDLDLIKNKAVAYEAETQYASLGVEFDVFRTLQLRAGYRANLVSGGTDVVTAGFGLSPFGVHIDVAAMANPSDYLREAGAVMDLGFYF